MLITGLMLLQVKTKKFKGQMFCTKVDSSRLLHRSCISRPSTEPEKFLSLGKGCFYLVDCRLSLFRVFSYFGRKGKMLIQESREGLGASRALPRYASPVFFRSPFFAPRPNLLDACKKTTIGLKLMLQPL